MTALLAASLSLCSILSPATAAHVEREAVRQGVPVELARAPSMNTVLVEFEDGYKVTTSRYAVRLASEVAPVAQGRLL